METQISVIGGTMGLFTGSLNTSLSTSSPSGFSILSGVEIVYFLIKLLLTSAGNKKRKLINSV